jgi:formylglycine-generating enzyme required for sulfatase activity
LIVFLSGCLESAVAAGVYIAADAATDGEINGNFGAQEDPEIKELCDNPPCGSAMISIESNCFTMGDTDGAYDHNEWPAHDVCVSDFSIDKYEVTNEDYYDCVAEEYCLSPKDVGSSSADRYFNSSSYSKFPVIFVDWYMARDYCRWVGKRLPTEAEWEYAGRGPDNFFPYPWEGYIDQSMANYDSNDTEEVGSYQTNGFGLYDMAGNVWEWVNDRYREDYYEDSPEDDPLGPASGVNRVLRGGSWNNYAESLRVSKRYYVIEDSFSDRIGFRCAK